MSFGALSEEAKVSLARLDFALDAGADYIILDGRGGGTGAAPLLFRYSISVPTIADLTLARRHLDRREASDRVTLIITGGLRTHADFIKAMALRRRRDRPGECRDPGDRLRRGPPL